MWRDVKAAISLLTGVMRDMKATITLLTRVMMTDATTINDSITATANRMISMVPPPCQLVVMRMLYQQYISKGEMR